jgi:hypothetical protein
MGGARRFIITIIIVVIFFCCVEILVRGRLPLFFKPLMEEV